jgi:hypothetical protein
MRLAEPGGLRVAAGASGPLVLGDARAVPVVHAGPLALYDPQITSRQRLVREPLLWYDDE